MPALHWVGKDKVVTPPSVPGEFLLYEAEDGRTRLECRLVDETLWLAQARMADLFQTSKQNIAKHLKPHGRKPKEAA